jgi:hypothetical protein
VDELKKKYEMTIKEKTLLKLEKDKLANRANDLSSKIKEHEDKVSKDIEKTQKRQGGFSKEKRSVIVRGKNTPYPKEDARPNPFLARQYDDFNSHCANVKNIKVLKVFKK